MPGLALATHRTNSGAVGMLQLRPQHKVSSHGVSTLAPVERRRMASISVFWRGKSGKRKYLAHTKWQMELVPPAAQVQQAGFHQHRIPQLPGEEGERRKRETQRHAQQHHSWELTSCNKGPVSGPGLRAIKTAATDLRETAGIFLRNPDYVATAEPEQKASTPSRQTQWRAARGSNQLSYPKGSASATHPRASSQCRAGSSWLWSSPRANSTITGTVKNRLP